MLTTAIHVHISVAAANCQHSTFLCHECCRWLSPVLERHGLDWVIAHLREFRIRLRLRKGFEVAFGLVRRDCSQLTGACRRVAV